MDHVEVLRKLRESYRPFITETTQAFDAAISAFDDAKRWQALMKADRIYASNGTLLFVHQGAPDSLQIAVDRIRLEERCDGTR